MAESARERGAIEEVHPISKFRTVIALALFVSNFIHDGRLAKWGLTKHKDKILGDLMNDLCRMVKIDHLGNKEQIDEDLRALRGRILILYGSTGLDQTVLQQRETFFNEFNQYFQILEEEEQDEGRVGEARRTEVASNNVTSIPLMPVMAQIARAAPAIAIEKAPTVSSAQPTTNQPAKLEAKIIPSSGTDAERPVHQVTHALRVVRNGGTPNKLDYVIDALERAKNAVFNFLIDYLRKVNKIQQ